ncbi:MAG: hypothetical protein IT429_15325 [Gemmataceae bacterium]|nr:hypothetical protein [Gemmataceae bacterium]
MLLVAEIGMLVLGIITVATGKLSTSAGKECRGVPARIAGVLLILPLPISLLIGLMIAVILTSQGRNFDERAAWPTLVELGVFLVFVITAFVIAGMNARPIGRTTARRRRDDYDERDYPEERLPRGYRDDRGYGDPNYGEGPRRPPDDRIR